MTDNFNLTIFSPIVNQVTRETCDKNRDDADTWRQLRTQWADHYKNEIPDELLERRNQLLMAVRFTECFQTLFWIESLALGGGYYLAIRELRSMLEGVIQAYYIDIKYPDVDVAGKLAVLNEMIDVGGKVSHGIGLLKTALPSRRNNKPWERMRNDIFNLYRELCSFVHPNVTQMERILGSSESDKKIIELMRPVYDQDLFKQCCQFSKRVFSRIIDIDLDFVQESTT
jgi:hypothetical protein